MERNEAQRPCTVCISGRGLESYAAAHYKALMCGKSRGCDLRFFKFVFFLAIFLVVGDCHPLSGSGVWYWYRSYLVLSGPCITKTTLLYLAL